MKSSEWKTYRTRFLVKAKQLSSSLTFVDHLGRQHCGRKGDYLVESYDGVLSIAPRQIFEDIYVPMSARHRHDGAPLDSTAIDTNAPNAVSTAEFQAEALKIEAVKDACPRIAEQRRSDQDKLPRTARKSPQPVRATSSRLSLM
jgi:hypothetical protein